MKQPRFTPLLTQRGCKVQKARRSDTRAAGYRLALVGVWVSWQDGGHQPYLSGRHAGWTTCTAILQRGKRDAAYTDVPLQDQQRSMARPPFPRRTKATQLARPRENTVTPLPSTSYKSLLQTRTSLVYALRTPCRPNTFPQTPTPKLLLLPLPALESHLSSIPDETSLGDLFLPGTHQSLALRGCTSPSPRRAV